MLKKLFCKEKARKGLFLPMVEEDIETKYKQIQAQEAYKDWKPEYEIRQRPDGRWDLLKQYLQHVDHEPYVLVMQRAITSDQYGFFLGPRVEPFDTVDDAEAYMYRLIAPEIYVYDSEGRSI